VLVQENNLYFFKHDLVKQALYNSLLNYNKKILHRLVANLLFKQRSPNMLRLVHHLARAEDWRTLEKVIFEDPSYLQRMEFLKFIDLLQERVDKQDTSKQFTFLFTKAAILFNNGKTEGAESNLQEIMRMAVSEKRPEFSARAYHLLTANYAKAHCFDKTLFCGERAVYYYRKSNPSNHLIQSAYNDMALSALLSGDSEENQRIIDHMEHIGAGGYDMKTASAAERAFYLGEYRSATEILAGALPPDKLLTNENWILGTVLLVRVLRQCYDFEALRPKVLDLLDVFSQDYATLTDLYSYMAEASFFLGENEKMGAYLKQAEYYATQGQIDFNQINSLRSLSTALYHVGDLEAAEKFVCRGLELGLRHSTYYPTFSLLVLMAEIYDRHGAHEDARYMLDDAAFFVRSGTLLARQDLIMYHYLNYRLTPGDKNGALGDLRRAADLLGQEKAAIAEDRLIRRFLTVRRYSKVDEETTRSQ
jgi:tetratricopeptide (TPR) repeat protein